MKSLGYMKLPSNFRSQASLAQSGGGKHLMTPIYDAPPGDPMALPRKCILMVEDELLIRISVSDELRDAGYDVIEAVNADEAWTILTSSVNIDLVVSDVRPAGSLDGMDLLALIRNSFPSLPVIITSGHLQPSHAISEGAKQFLRKPFSLGGVVKAVCDELSAVNDSPTRC